jgi:hypothetical protein
MPKTPTAAATPLRTVWVAFALAVCGLAVYGNALPNPFLIDDKYVVLNDPRVQTCDIGAIFTQEYWPGAVGNRLYRPLTTLSLAVNWAISHKPWTFRLVNLLLHVAAGLGLYLLAREGTRSTLIACGAALLFVVHPIHTTPLNQIVDRADLAAAAGVLWAAWLHYRERDPTAAPHWWRPVLVAALFAAALLCKENAVALLGIAVWLDVCRRATKVGHGRPTAATGVGRYTPVAPASCRCSTADMGVGRYGRRMLRSYVPLVMVLGLYLLVRGAVLGGTVRAATQICPLDNIIAHPEYGLEAGESPWLVRWGTPVAVFGQAARLLVWPHALSWDYSYAAIDSVRKWSDPRLWLGLATLAACGFVVASALRKRWAAVGVGVGFLLISYSVVSNTFLVIGGVFAERYLYLPSAAFCWLVAGIFGARHCPRSFALAALTIASLACGIQTIVRNRDFVSQETLNAADLRAQPRSSRLWAAVGGDRLLAGAYDVALQHAEQALTIYPENATAWRVAGFAHWRLGQFEPALTALFKSIAQGEGDNENTWAAIGSIYVARGEPARAIEALTSFVESHPNAATVLNNLAWYLLTAEPASVRNPARAVDYARRAAALQPAAADFADTYYSALTAMGRPEEARQMLAGALQRIPASDPLYAVLVKKLQAP